MDLLLEWDERRRAGRPPTVEELCPDDSDMQHRLRERIRKRERIEAMLQPSTVVGPTTNEPAKPTIPVVEGYEILEVIGHGGMGVVYKARHKTLNRTVALKMILSGSAATDGERTRFRAEAEAAAQLQHPNIVQVYEIGEAAGRPFLALEYVPGGSLAAQLTGDGVDPRRAAELILPLADAVRHAHENGIVHRDLKPANILIQRSEARGQRSVSTSANNTDVWPLTSDICPKVADFGLAKRLDVDRGQTQTGAILGSPNYMPPEQAMGDVKAIGPAADIYALGAILYELLTGRPPFRAGSLLETLELVRKGEPVAPRHLRARVPRDLETICLKCLEREPRKRYASAGDLADDLRRFLSNEPIHAQEDGIAAQLARLLGRTEFDSRVHRFGTTSLWLSPWPILVQSIVRIGWGGESYYPYVALSTLLTVVVISVGVLVLSNSSTLREIPGPQRRHYRAVWVNNVIASFLIMFVVAFTIRMDHPSDLLVIVPLMVIVTATSIMSQTTMAGVMYVVATVFYVVAVLMTLDLSLAPLEAGALMTSNMLFHGFYLRRFRGGSQ
jgi:serine/threonine protein kinase